MAMEWQKLVSEGHVRAARLRTAQPIVIGLASFLIVVGGMGVMALSPPRASDILDYGSVERLEERSARIEAFMRSVPAPDLTDAQINTLAPAYELQQVATLISASLNETGALPELLPFEERNRSEFWGFEWDNNRLNTLERGGLILVGAIVSEEWNVNRQRVIQDPVRWIALFRQTDDGSWVTYELWFTGAARTDGLTVIDPSDYPIAFNELIPSRFLNEEEA